MSTLPWGFSASFIQGGPLPWKCDDLPEVKAPENRHKKNSKAKSEKSSPKHFFKGIVSFWQCS